MKQFFLLKNTFGEREFGMRLGSYVLLCKRKKHLSNQYYQLLPTVLSYKSAIGGLCATAEKVYV